MPEKWRKIFCQHLRDGRLSSLTLLPPFEFSLFLRYNHFFEVFSLSKKIISILIALFVFASLASGAEVLTLTEFVKSAIKTNPSYRISAQDYLIALETNQSAKSLEDWNLIASGAFSESTASPSSGFSPTYQKVASYSLSAKRYIAQTGTEIKLEHSNSRIQSKYPPIPIPGTSFFPTSPYYTSSLSLSISQPLLRNAFGLTKKNTLKLSDYSLNLATIKLSEDWEDFIAMLREEYLIWQKCHRNVNVFKDKVRKVEDQLALVKKQKKYGLSEDLDLVQTKQKVEGYRIMLEQAKMACETQSRKILLMAGKSQIDSEEISPEKIVVNRPILKEKTAISYLATNSNLKQTADIMVSIQETNLETKRDQKRIDLELVLKTSPNAFTNKFSESLSHIGDYNENSLSLKASRPLSNQKAEAEAKGAENEYKKALREREEILLNAEIGLSSLYTNLKYLDNMLDLNQSNFKLAKERLILEKKKFNQGRSSVFFVLQAEDEVLMAENTMNETFFARESIINQIQSFTDRYLVEYKDLLKI
jgi:outer membrane protein TolC